MIFLGPYRESLKTTRKRGVTILKQMRKCRLNGIENNMFKSTQVEIGRTMILTQVWLIPKN